MKKLLGILVLSLLLSSNANAVPKWIDSKIISICKVKQDIVLNMNWLQDDGKWELEPIYLKKGDYLSVHKKKKNNQKYYATSSAVFPVKNNEWDKVTVSKKYEGVKIKDVIVDCRKVKNKIKKISYDTYDIFTQEDLFNGLKDNKKIKGKGELVFPVQEKCKKIKKYPVMFLIHHSGGDIMMDYKHILHEMCVATFEPYIFRARGHESNFYDTTKDIAWTTEQAGVLDSLISLDVVSKNKKVNVSKIGIMGWSYGGTVAIEAQNNFNIDLIKPKNKFALHLALYPYCFSYENSKTTNAPLFILMGDKDYLPHTLCEEYIKVQDDLENKNKKLVVFPGATHSYDKTGSGYVDGSIVSPECRIYTDNNGELWVRPNDPEKWFNITANGGWFGKKGDKKLYSNAMRLCWGYGPSLTERNANAYEQTMKIFIESVEKYLLN